ncbi:MAG TPA: hydroxysqualene dehydroxylase HpnE [Actinomycetota bacterium]
MSGSALSGRDGTSRPHIAVVGGGLAGLAAALACADGGAGVTLFEARPRLGGATFSFRREGLWVDNGQHVFLRCCTAYRGFLSRIGAEDLTVLQDRMAIPVMSPGGRTGWLRRSGLPAPLHLARSLARYPFLGPLDRVRAVGAALALSRLDPDDPKLDRRTFGAWLAEHGQSPAAVESLWNLIALPTLNLEAAQASLALAVKVFRTGLLSERDAADVGYARVPLSELHAEPALRALEQAGAPVHLRTPIRRVARTDGDGFQVVAEDGSSHADAVVVALPHDRVAEVLPAGALPNAASTAARLGVSPIVNVHVVFDRPVTDLPFVAGVGSPVQWVFDRTRPSGLERGQYLAISLSGADREIEERSEDLRERFLPALQALFPRARQATVERFFVTREHAATFRQAPGTRSLRPGPVTGVPGLFLAGAWTDTGWPATMEGAVRSGLSAAGEALATMGRTRALPEAVPA